MGGVRLEVLALCGLCAGAGAQGTTGRNAAATPPPPGTVVGRVTCEDTQRPARLAQVRLIPVPTKGSGTSGSKIAPSKDDDSLRP